MNYASLFYLGILTIIAGFYLGSKEEISITHEWYTYLAGLAIMIVAFVQVNGQLKVAQQTLKAFGSI